MGVGSMASQKESKSGSQSVKAAVGSKAELQQFITDVKKGLNDGSIAAIYGLTAVRNILDQEGVAELIDQGSKSSLKEIWISLEKAGCQSRRPPILFDEAEQELRA